MNQTNPPETEASMAQKKLFAITEIHLEKTPGKAGDKSKGIAPTRPRTRIVKAGQIFLAKTKELQDELIGMAAARVATDEDLKAHGFASIDGDDSEDDTSTEETETPSKAKTENSTEASEGNGEGNGGANDDELETARARYEELAGKKPGSMKLETLNKKIKELEEAADKEDDLV
jgi:hypothetical protein